MNAQASSALHELVDSKEFVVASFGAPEPIHKIDHTTQKQVVVIGKMHFLMCKQLMQDNAPDEEYARLLNIPLEKVRYFKHKMQIFEDKIRARRRAARLNRRRGRRNRRRPEGSLLNGGIIKKKEMTAEERFKYARELILENYSTQEIAKVLRVSERSVTRFRRRINEQKRRLQEEGKLAPDAAAVGDDEEEEYKFKFLSAEVKAEKINELYEKGMAATEIAKVLKISDRSVRRWKIKLDEMKTNPDGQRETKRELRKRRKSARGEAQRQFFRFHDRSVIERARVMVDEGVTNKEIGERLQLPMNVARKLVQAILDGTAHMLVDDAVEAFTSKRSQRRVKVERKKHADVEDESEVLVEAVAEGGGGGSGGAGGDEDDDFWNTNLNEMKWGESASSSSSDGSGDEDTPFARISERVKNSIKSKREREIESMDPLSFVEVEETAPNPSSSTSSTATVVNLKTHAEKRGKMCMGEREVIIAKLLKEKGIRAVDIALLMNVSERSVTRLLAKAKELVGTKFDEDIIEHVNDLADNKDEIIEARMKTMPVLKESKGYDDTKRKTGMRLLAMNVKPKDIAKMLNVSDKTIKRWQTRLELEQEELKRRGLDDSGSGHEVFNELSLSLKQEPDYDIDDDSEYFE